MRAPAQSGWFWQNPLPQGNGLAAVAGPAPGIAIAVGEVGTIVRTSDGGATWTVQSIGTSDRLAGVSFVDADTGWAVGFLGECCLARVFRTSDGGATWQMQVNGAFWGLNGVSFADANTGFGVGLQGTVVRTTNGGDTWAVLGFTRGLTYYGIAVVDANIATVVGDAGRILRTSDGGNTWVQQIGTSETLFGVSFVDANTGTAVGGHGTILRTVDGGASWTLQDSGVPFDLHSVSFADVNIGTAVGSSGTILHTINGGATWSAQDGGRAGLVGVFVEDASFAWAVGGAPVDVGTILRTTDGDTWAVQAPIGPTNHLFGISFVDANTGTAVGADGTILRTTDGASWMPQDSGTTNALLGTPSSMPTSELRWVSAVPFSAPRTAAQPGLPRTAG